MMASALLCLTTDPSFAFDQFGFARPLSVTHRVAAVNEPVSRSTIRERVPTGNPFPSWCPI